MTTELPQVYTKLSPLGLPWRLTDWPLVVRGRGRYMFSAHVPQVIAS